ALLADGGEHDDRRRGPRAKRACDFDAGGVRQDEIEDHRLQRPQRGGRERAFRGVRRVDLVPGGAQARAQRAQDLLLVVDDEHARRAHAGTSDGTGAVGSASTNVAPWPTRDSAQTRPPFAVANPRAIASPSPAPEPRAPAPRWKGSKIGFSSPGSIPGPLSM